MNKLTWGGESACFVRGTKAERQVCLAPCGTMCCNMATATSTTPLGQALSPTPPVGRCAETLLPNKWRSNRSIENCFGLYLSIEYTHVAEHDDKSVANLCRTPSVSSHTCTRATKIHQENCARKSLQWCENVRCFQSPCRCTQTLHQFLSGANL